MLAFYLGVVEYFFDSFLWYKYLPTGISGLKDLQNDSRQASVSDESQHAAELHLEVAGRQLSLLTTWGLFSPREIDAGTRLLVDQLRLEGHEDCLDLGCGYGPIGCAMALLAPEGKTMMVDRDFVAVEYAKLNAIGNGLTNIEVTLSNGFSSIDAMRFDLIASNLPAKVGREMLDVIFRDTALHLRPEGRFIVVVVAGLRQLVKRQMKTYFGNYEKLKQGKRHSVYQATR